MGLGMVNLTITCWARLFWALVQMHFFQTTGHVSSSVIKGDSVRVQHRPNTSIHSVLRNAAGFL